MTPQMLPGGMHILLTLSEGSNWDDADIVVQSLKDGGRQILVHGGVAGRYVNSGHLIYGHSGSLHAVRFDLSTRRVSGPAVPVVSGIAQATSGGAWGGLEYAVSDTGTLAYVPAAAVAIRRVLVWVDRSGREEQVPAEPRAYEYPRISPDGARVLVESRDEQNDLWSWDLVRGTLTRVTFNRRSGGPGVWTHDGTHVLFGPDRRGIINIFQQHFGGTGSEERLLTSPNTQYADVVSPDGRWLVYEETDPTTKFDLRLLALGGSRASTPLLHMPFNEQNADISPDGRWLAYQSDESGRAEVYVRPFPDVAEGRWQISTGGGTRPLWSRDGRELFYLDADRQLTAAPVETRSSFRVTSAARKLFDTKPFGMAGINRNFDVSPDGKRFLFTKNLRTPPDAKRIIVVGNWLEDLKQRVPAK
jgi:serine/threonine-protein kinase